MLFTDSWATTLLSHPTSRPPLPRNPVLLLRTYVIYNIPLNKRPNVVGLYSSAMLT